MVAFCQKAEHNQACLSVLFCSEFGHKRSFEQTNKRSDCASFVKTIASIEDPAVINQILAHLDEKAATAVLPPCRASPARGWFD
jgi:hypothetical protein